MPPGIGQHRGDVGLAAERAVALDVNGDQRDGEALGVRDHGASSALSPDHETAMTTSPFCTMPRSPWLASVAWTKNAGRPVEAKVAAILRPTWPDLPRPVTITRPGAAAIARPRAEGAIRGPLRRARRAPRHSRKALLFNTLSSASPAANGRCAARFSCALLPRSPPPIIPVRQSVRAAARLSRH